MPTLLVAFRLCRCCVVSWGRGFRADSTGLAHPWSKVFIASVRGDSLMGALWLWQFLCGLANCGIAMLLGVSRLLPVWAYLLIGLIMGTWL